ncbi:MAG: hypothetical protein VKK04_20420 [Synechococcales bacterium]|nr:hypothetical protein [Synechococcales bacterium]
MFGYKVFVQPQAEIDLLIAYQGLEDQWVGRGNDFFRSIDRWLEETKEEPQKHPVVHQEYETEVRQGFVPQFPYRIFYLLSDDAIVIMACFKVSDRYELEDHFKVNDRG